MAKLLGSLARDANGAALQTACWFATVDATTPTPQASPLTYDATTPVVLQVPVAATQLDLGPSTALRVSEQAGMSSYDVVPAAAKEALAVAGMDRVYVRGDTTGGTLTFRFVGV